MNTDQKKFLNELLSTSSTSGNEVEIQKKWIKYVSKFAHTVKTDNIGNAIGIINPDAKFKILLAGHCDEIGFIVTGIDDKGFISFAKVGGISPKIAPGMKVEIKGYKKTIIGVIGANAEHHGGLKDKFQFTDLYIDCGAKDKKEIAKYVKIGDYATYKREPEFLLNNRLSARGLDNKSGAFIVAEVLKNVANINKNIGVYCVSTISEEIGLHGAYFAAAGIKPNAAIACDVTFSTDYPGVDTKEHGEYFLDKGPVLAIGSPINKKINSLLEDSAKKLKMNLQYELTPSGTGTDADRMRFTGDGVPVALVSLPLRYMHSPVETVSLNDIDAEIELLTDMLLSLKGDEDFRPIIL